MTKIGINIVASNFNAVSDDLSVGLPSPVSIYGYIRSILINSGCSVDTDIDDIYYGVKFFQHERANEGGTLPGYIRITSDPHVKGKSGSKRVGKAAIYDQFRAYGVFSIIFSTDLDLDDDFENRLLMTMLTRPFLGGQCLESEWGCHTSVKVNPDEWMWLKGSKMLVNRTDEMMSVSKAMGITPIQSLLISQLPELTFSTDDDDLIGGVPVETVKKVKESISGNVIPCPIGYRLLEDPISDRAPMKDGTDLHAYGESVTGLAELVNINDSAKEHFLYGSWSKADSEFCNSNGLFFLIK